MNPIPFLHSAAGWRVRLLARACARSAGLALLLLLLCMAPLLASPLQRWEAFTAVRGHSVGSGEHGLALRHTTAVAEDAAGRVWIGQYSALNRLDGDIMRRYVRDTEPLLAEGYIHQVLPLPNGDVLIGGDREGVLYWEARSDTLRAVALADGRRLTRINALVPARDGGFWVASEQGLYAMQANADLLQPVPASGLEGTASRRVFDVREMDDGTLWLAAQPGLYRRAPGATGWEPVALDDAAMQARLRSEPAWRLARDDRGRLWVGLMRQGVTVLDGRGGAAAPAGLDGEQGLHAGTTVRSLFWDAPRQRMLVGTDGEGLMQVDAAVTTARRLAVNLSVFTGGRKFHVRSLAAGRDGRIWAASDRGVFHFDPAPAALREIDASLPGRDPYEAPVMGRSAHVDTRGRLWLGQTAGNIQVLDPASGQRHHIQLPAPLDNSAVAALVDDGQGRVWAIGQGVARIDAHSLRVLPWTDGPLSARRHYTGLATDGQRMWLTHHEGLLEVDLDGRVLRRMDDLSRGLLTTRLDALAWRPGQLWVGSSEGVHVVDLAQWQARAVPADTRQPDSFRATASLLADDDGIWVGSLGGVARGLGDAPASLTTVVDTQGSEVRGLLDDGNGGMWLSVDERAARLRWRDRHGNTLPVTVRHGLHPDAVFYRGGLARTADGLLVAVSDTGALLLDPQALGQSAPPAVDLSPHLFEVSLDGQRLPADRLPGPERALHLHHDVERLVIAFSAVDYTGGKLRQYSYRLEGLDSRWNTVSGIEPMVFYSRLPAGQYTLSLRTTSQEFPGQAWITQIPVVVHPAWYQTGWSRLALAMLLALLLYGLYRYRTRRVRRRQQRLEAMVAQRTRDLEQANARLAQLASEDGLTGLLTRRRALELMALRHQQLQHGGQDAVLLLDLDNFKLINDTHGHLAGDAVLRQTAQRLRQALREGDIIARYGGEELLVVLPDTPPPQARALAEALLQALRQAPVDHQGVAIAVRASLGLGMMTAGQGLQTALAQADAALYRAKAQGRDRVCSAP